MKESKQMPLKIGRCPFSPICSKYFQRIEYRTPISVWSLHGQFRYIRTRSMSTVSAVTSSKRLLFAESSFGFGPCKNQRFPTNQSTRWSNLSKMAQRNQSGDFSNRLGIIRFEATLMFYPRSLPDTWSCFVTWQARGIKKELYSKSPKFKLHNLNGEMCV